MPKAMFIVELILLAAAVALVCRQSYLLYQAYMEHRATRPCCRNRKIIVLDTYNEEVSGDWEANRIAEDGHTILDTQKGILMRTTGKFKCISCGQIVVRTEYFAKQSDIS